MGCKKIDLNTSTVSSIEKDEDFLHWVNTRNANWLGLIIEKQAAYNEIKNKDSLVEYFALDFDKVAKAEVYYISRIAQKWGVDTAVAREKLYKYLLQNGRYYDSVSRNKFPLSEEWLLYHQLINEGRMPWIGFTDLAGMNNTNLQRSVNRKGVGANAGEL